MPTVDELRERLTRPLQRELEMGCQNRVVTAGLEALVNNVAKPFPKVRELLRGYAEMDAATRELRLRAALASLDRTEASTAQRARTRVTAPPPPALSRLSAASEVNRLTLSPGGPRKLVALGVRTIRDLWHYYPRRYEDRRALPDFGNVPDGDKVTVEGVVTAKGRHSPKPGMLILSATLRDDLGRTLKATWFNKPWIEKDLKPGARLVVTGKVKRFGRQLTLNVEYHEVEEGEGESLATGRIIGVYPSQEGTSQDFLRKAVRAALDAAPDPGDYLPAAVRGRYDLVRLDQALRNAHFPPDEAALQTALSRLKFDEFLFLELRVLLQGSHGTLGKQFTAPDNEIERFKRILPFELTGAQKRALAAIVEDMRSSRQMARLLQGDVGSGKTAVAACALYLVTVDGLQGALMAPTEILARQHFDSLTRFLFPLGVRVELLTGAMTARERKLARERIAGGEVQVVVGTQALIQEGVSFANLGLAVVDEEHRFGVMQRRALLADRPDVLVMSATPIPRSLALTAYGDLELTVIDELPPGRSPVKTKLVMDTYRTQAYHFVMKEVRAGRQAYVVTPLIEESEALSEILAATRLAEDLRTILPEARIELLHGKMPPADKAGVMNGFRAGDFDILVSTTVIEVGVDIPNATVMVIENAERFGLSQLHQLRGRVGRGASQSYCVLITGEHSKKTRERLKVIENSTDGFKIAEADLKLRGPGELRGTRQSGMDDLKLGDLSTDTEVIERARALAKEILAADPRLERPDNGALRAELTARAEQVAVRDVI